MKRVNKRDEPLYFSVKEVCKLLQIKPHILDYWEKRFPEIKPHKIAKRNFYKKEQLELLFQIKKLLDEGYTLEGARRKLFSAASNIEKVSTAQALFPELKTTSKAPSKNVASSSEREKKLKKILDELLQELKEIYHSL